MRVSYYLLSKADGLQKLSEIQTQPQPSPTTLTNLIVLPASIHVFGCVCVHSVYACRYITFVPRTIF